MLLLVATALIACKGDKSASATHDALGGGKCAAGENCDFTCHAGCDAQCIDSHCTAKCDDGDCTLDADLGAVSGFDCAGGGCSIDCDGASDCSVQCGGGGCEVGCDGESKCKVSCGDKGDPCKVTCEAGARASCDNQHCELTGCEQCDPNVIDDSYKPSLKAADYTPNVDNPLYPLPVGAKWVFESPDEIITVSVMKDTYLTAAGVECAVVHDQAKDKQGQVTEDTLDYFAQDREGNVWYFGEKTAEYVNGKVSNTRGSWEAGVDGALPGIVVHAKTPKVGTMYRQEYYRCEAEDMGEILALGESVKVPTGTYKDCIVTRDYSPLEPTANEHKFFCPGVGLVRVDEVPEGKTEFAPVETLTSVTLH
jgi:hypothetical protein